MKIKTIKFLAMTVLALAFAENAAASDPAAQAAEEAAVAVETQDQTQVQTEAAATAEAAAAPETEAQSAMEKSTAEADAAVSSKSKMDFEEKVTAYNEDKKDDDKVICRRVKKTGSHFSRRRCVTAAQAEREREDAQDALQRASRGTNSGPTN